MRAWWTPLAPSRPRSAQRRGQGGQGVNTLNALPTGIAISTGLQGSFGMGRAQVTPHPSGNRGSRALRG